MPRPAHQPQTTPSLETLVSPTAPRLFLGTADGEQPCPPVTYPEPEHVPSAVWDLGAAPHALLVGATSSTLAALGRTIALEALLAGMTVWCLDGPQTGAWASFSDSDAAAVVDEPEAILEALASLTETARGRVQQLRAARLAAARTRGRLARPTWPRTLVLFSEPTVVFREVGRGRTGIPDPTAARDLTRLARLSAEVGIHLAVLSVLPIAGMARPLPDLDEYLPLRVALGPISSSQAGHVFGDYSTIRSVVDRRDGGVREEPRERRPAEGVLQACGVRGSFQAALTPDPLSFDTVNADRTAFWRRADEATALRRPASEPLGEVAG